MTELTHPALLVVDGEIPEQEGFGLGPPAQRRANPRGELGRREGFDDMAAAIMPPRICPNETVPAGPSREDFLRLLATTEGDRPADKRDRAILMLCAAYGLRSGEVRGLQLDDLDWENETLRVRRSKPGRTHLYPLARGVGHRMKWSRGTSFHAAVLKPSIASGQPSRSTASSLPWLMPSPSTSSLDRPRGSAKLSSCSGFAWNVPSNAFANLLFHSEKQQVDSRMLSKFSLEAAAEVLRELGCGTKFDTLAIPPCLGRRVGGTADELNLVAETLLWPLPRSIWIPRGIIDYLPTDLVPVETVEI